MMRTMLRKICRLTLAVTLAAGMTVGLGACNNRQEAPTNNTQGEQTAAPANGAQPQQESQCVAGGPREL